MTSPPASEARCRALEASVAPGADIYLTYEEADRIRGADEVMGRAYDHLAEAAQHLTVQHPAAESVGRAIDVLAGWLGRRTIIIGGPR